MTQKFSAAASFLFLFAEILSAQPPAITPGEVLNAASSMPPVLPAGKLAPGMKIVLSGIRFVDPKSETTVNFTKGDWRASVRPSMLADRKLEVTLPKDTPLGNVGIAVMNAEGSSRVEQVPVAESVPGIATLNGEGWGPASNATYRPGQSVTLPVNGLNETKPQVFVAGVAAPGVKLRGEELTFDLPRSAPTGCWTPVWIQSKTGELSNFVTISTSEKPGGTTEPGASGNAGPLDRLGGRAGPVPASENGRDCKQAPGWLGRRAALGTRTGLAVAEKIRGEMEQAGKIQTFDFDSGAAFFFRAATGAPTVLQLLPPESSCLTYANAFSLTGLSLLRVQQAIGPSDVFYDAGARLVIRSDGSKGGNQESYLDAAQGSQGYYTGLFGGVLPLPQPNNKPLFLFPGMYRIHAEGGKDLGSFDLPLKVSPPFEWPESATLDEVDRKAGVALEWSGLASDRQMVALAFNADLQKSTLGSTICLAPRGATHFTIPPSAFANFLPTSGIGTLPLHFVVLISIPSELPEQAVPKGLDEARSIYLEIQAKSVRFR